MRGYNFSIPGARENIESGTKVLTMRKDRKDGWLPKVGEEIKLTDGRRWVKAGEIGSIQPILINGKNPVCTWVGPVEIKISPHYGVETNFFTEIMGCDESDWNPYFISWEKVITEFSRMDGWNSPDEMFRFFKPRMKNGHIKLNLIYWGPR